MSSTKTPPRKKGYASVSPVGSSHTEAMKRRASNPEYRAEQERILPYERIARIVISRRMALGLTQQELADLMGTSHSVISRIESGQRPTTVTTLGRLAEAFGTTLVVGFDDEPDEQADISTGRGRQLVAV